MEQLQDVQKYRNEDCRMQVFCPSFSKRELEEVEIKMVEECHSAAHDSALVTTISLAPGE